MHACALITYTDVVVKLMAYCPEIDAGCIVSFGRTVADPQAACVRRRTPALALLLIALCLCTPALTDGSNIYLIGSSNVLHCIMSYLCMPSHFWPMYSNTGTCEFFGSWFSDCTAPRCGQIEASE